MVHVCRLRLRRSWYSFIESGFETCSTGYFNIGHFRVRVIGKILRCPQTNKLRVLLMATVTRRPYFVITVRRDPLPYSTPLHTSLKELSPSTRSKWRSLGSFAMFVPTSSSALRAPNDMTPINFLLDCPDSHTGLT